MNSINSEKQLTKKDLRKSWTRWFFNNMACYSYERYMGVGFLHAMSPVIKRLYGGDAAETQQAMQRHTAFFNTEPCFGSPIVGLAAAMEEKRANGSNIDDDGINSVKSGLMGPISGIGDSVIQGVLVPLLLALAISISESGNLAGPILYVILITAIVVTISYGGFMIGYSKGNEAIMSMLESGVINKVITGAGIVGCTVLGALVANYVSLSLAIEIPTDGDPFSVQTQLFDVLVPKLLPLLLTLGCYKLLCKRISSLVIMLLMVALGIVGGLLGIF
jgi:PTS system mannose-specific IID component